jgi:hypothetical protein
VEKIMEVKLHLKSIIEISILKKRLRNKKFLSIDNENSDFTFETKSNGSIFKMRIDFNY